ncbi:MAG: hypothetical protein AB7P22_09020, partial [Vicinamibacterales bacterium]
YISLPVRRIRMVGCSRNVLRRPAILLAILLAAAAAPYLSGGSLDAYFAGDDFEWLFGASALGWQRAFEVSTRSASYRPVIDLWFVGLRAVCGQGSACHHAASLLVHLAAVAMLFTLARLLCRDLRIAVIGAAMFAFQPAQVQAVVWVAAIPNTLGAAFLLASLLAQALSWESVSEGSRRAWEATAVSLFAAAVLSHEASITMLAVSGVMWHFFAPRSILRRPIMTIGLTVVCLFFAWATVVSNRSNALFPEGRYGLGEHVVRHFFEFLAQLTVGPRWWLSDLLWIVALAGLLVASRATRFSTLWMLVALLPYLGFTAGNVSRYHYVPAMGFSLALAAALVNASDWIASRLPARRTWIAAGTAVVAAFLIIRFARFCYPAVESEARSLEPWREYAVMVRALNPGPVGPSIRVPAPEDPAIEERYLQPMLRWLFQDNDLQVIVERTARRAEHAARSTQHRARQVSPPHSPITFTTTRLRRRPSNSA